MERLFAGKARESAGRINIYSVKSVKVEIIIVTLSNQIQQI